MSLFAIGDTHLSLRTNKPMDIFNGWNDYVPRLEKNWRALVQDDDTVVIAGVHKLRVGQKVRTEGS